ncbi:hypothetical protein FDA33_11865 [Clostridium botulinum]|nr:hypothetical protein [Clostridium botulinum]NFI17324.1 hypothetical protein [Clostridium botulinum]NFL92099.1 hypothetical protein [Clostridium botulinum]NFN52127.1 hypothetical protein [Clostridium botulinum]NFO26660.1 hypothetical protein [Clostridium botulinum]
MAKTLQTNIAIGGKINPTLQKAFSMVNKYASGTISSINKVNSTTANASQYTKNQLDSLGTKIKTVLAVGAIGIGVKKLSSTMLDQASSMEQYRNTLNIVMKDQEKAGKTFAWAVQYANKTPFETNEIVDATVKLTNYGLEAQKVLPLTGDMAGAMGKSIDQATEAIADAQTGELERLKEFGITKNMIVAQGAKDLAGIEIVNNKGQITNQRAFNAALFSLMKERYSGAMEIQSKTFKGLMSTTFGIVKNGLGKIAGISETGEIIPNSAFDVIKQKLSGVTEYLLQMQENGSFDVLADKFTNFTQWVCSGIDTTIPVVQNFFKYVQDNGPQIKNTALFIGKAFLGWKAISGVSSGIQAIKGVSDSINILKGGMTALSIVKAKDKAQTIYLNSLYAKDAIARKASAIATGVQSTAHRIFNALKIKERIATLKTVAIYAKDAVVRGISIAVIGAQTVAQLALNSAFLACPITWIVIGIAALIAIFVLLWNKCEGFRNFFIAMWQGIQSAIQNFDLWITTAMTTDWTTSFGALGAILNSFFFIVGSVWNSIKLVFQGIVDFVTGIFTGNWSLAWQGVVEIFSGIMSGIGSVMKAPLNAVIGLINAAIGGINSISIDIPDWVPDWAGGGKHFGANIPQIPLLAKGGITDIPSICGEAGPESVIPLKRNNPRSISLLEKTASIVNPSGNNKDNGNSHTFVFSPVINGEATPESINMLKQSYEEFKEMVNKILNERERESFD